MKPPAQLSDRSQPRDPIRVTVWNEFLHEKKNPRVAALYPLGIHGTIAAHLRSSGYQVRTATLDQPEHGLSPEVLASTDVLVWWGHLAHHQVEDRIVDRAVGRVLEGMGLVVLHSGHFSKVFCRLMGTSCNLKWREEGGREQIWIIEPGHPICRGLPEVIEIPAAEMYGERFDIPAPDQLLMISSFEAGEVFRSGCCFHRGNGKIFYFRPGHETYPIYHHPLVLQVLSNAITWAAPSGTPNTTYGHRPSGTGRIIS